MQKIRWGLISTANINYRLIPAIRASTRGELVAVASRSGETAAAYAAEWGIPQSFDSYEAMLASDAVDAVYNPLPNHLHAEWSIKAMRAGKHVLCEKPFALTLAEVDEMARVSRETGCVIAEAFMYRHHPQNKAIAALVANGRLGQITLVQAIFNFKMRTAENIRLIPEYGGGSLWDVGVYPVSFAQHVLGGPPEAVLGRQWLGPSGVDLSFAGQMHYRGGAVAQIGCAFQSPFHTHATVIGTDGRLETRFPFTGDPAEKQQITFYPNGSDPEPLDIPAEYLYQGEVEDMHDAILHGQPSFLTLAETRNHIRTVLALYESARTGEIVTLSDE